MNFTKGLVYAIIIIAKEKGEIEMSIWSYVHGTIEVFVSGESQAEKTYYFDTVLKHLLKVSGSEHDMRPYVILERGHSDSSSIDEFENPSNLGEGYFETFNSQSHYLIVLSSGLRDREFDTTMREFAKWFYRLANRIMIVKALVSINCPSYGQKYLYDIEDMWDYWDSENNVYNLMEARSSQVKERSSEND